VDSSCRRSCRSLMNDGRARVAVYFRPLTVIPMLKRRASSSLLWLLFFLVFLDGLLDLEWVDRVFFGGCVG